MSEAAALVRSQTSLRPKVGIVLGSGLGAFADEVKASASIAYRDIPGFPVSTAIGHKGTLCIGELNGLPVVVMQGRFHLYEGYSAKQVSSGIGLLHELG